MSANTAPLFALTPNIGTVKIATTSFVAQSDGASTGATTNLMYSCFASGANGSILYRVRFTPVASAAAVNTVATCLRDYLSTVSTAVTSGQGSVAGATTNANTNLIGEITAPILSAANSINPATYFDITFNLFLPTGRWILVSQHIAQTTNQSWQATAVGGDY
jgi:hypothetical protein